MFCFQHNKRFLPRTGFKVLSGNAKTRASFAHHYSNKKIYSSCIIRDFNTSVEATWTILCMAYCL